MKAELLKSLKTLLFLPLFVLVLFTACQNEETDITNPNTDETFDGSSALAQSILSTATFDGSYDNILDSANCLSVNLPVTIEVNGITLTIESVDDFDDLEDILDALDTDDDDIVFIYPITISLSNYEQVVINNDDELAMFIDECFGENEPDDDIECIDFQFPISISVFDANFDFIETIEINNDEELYNFIDGLEDGVLASINFPVTMVLANGSTVEVTSNQQLQQIIAEAADDCDEDDDNDWNDDDCSEDSIELALKECVWEISNYNGDDIFNDYYIDFDPNYGFVVTNPNGAAIHDGTWSVSEIEGDFVITFTTDWEDLAGDWTVVNCDDNTEFNLVNGDVTMQIEQECDENTDPLGCIVTNEIVLCDENNDGVEVFNLYEGLSQVEDCGITDTVSITYHTTIQDAETNTNAIASVTEFSNTTNPQTIYVRVEVINNPSQYEILEMDLILENCNETCSEEQLDAFLMECHWVASSYNGDDQLAAYNIYFNENMELVVQGQGANFYGVWSTSGNPTNGVILDISQLSGGTPDDLNEQWQVVECTETQIIFLGATNNVQLVLDRNCEQSNTCSETDVQNYLNTCVWNVVNYNGSDDLIIFDFDFNNDGTVLISGDGQSITATWSTSISSNGGVEVFFANVNLGNIQAISGNWLVTDCQEDRLEFDNYQGVTMVMEQKNCYTTEELYDVATECRWEVFSYINDLGNDVTADYDGILYTFFDNGFVVAENGTTVGYGEMTAESTASEQLVVLLHLYNSVSGIGNYYTVENLSSEVIVLSTLNGAELIFHRTCASTNQDGDTAQIKTWLYDGIWQITYSTMESADNTTDYGNIIFDFQENANLLGTDGSTTANLNYEVLRDNEGNLRMVINYLGIFPYWQMDDDWYITEVLENRIELHHIDDDTNNEFVLVFEKL